MPEPSLSASRPNGVSWREYVDMRLEAMDKALGLSREVLDVRLEGMNRFREQLTKQSETFLTRSEYDAKHSLLMERIRQIELESAKISGKADQGAVYSARLIAVIGIIMGIVSIVLTVLHV